MKSTNCRMSTIVQILLLFCTQILGRQNGFNSNPALIESNHKSVDPCLDRYQADWSSLDRRPIPPWYDHAKIGIFIHWGVYAVPAFGTEWFWTNWRTAEHPAYVEFMARNYPPGFTYQQFGPQFTAELFNATEWADLFAASGARYVVLTSKHHDGFTMWPSRYSFGWNAIDIGPHRDVVGELAAAVRQHSAGMRFGLYHSLMEWYNPMYLADKKGEFAGNEFVTRKILPELKEIVQAYKPDVLWSDGDWEASDAYWNSTDFLAWLYNDSPVAGSVVTNDRWGSGTLCKHGDFFTCQDRYNPGVLQPHKWENAMTIDRGSWGHRVNAKLSDYLTTNELIAELVTTVSCGGNLLVNVGPNKAGTIEPIFEERLRQMGDWLRNNGDAVYESRPWIVQNDTRTTGVWYTSSKIQHKIVVHAIVLNYPLDSGIVRFYAINSKIEKPKHVSMLGYPDKMQFEDFPDYLLVQFPPKDQLDRLGLAHAWTIQIRW